MFTEVTVSRDEGKQTHQTSRHHTRALNQPSRLTLASSPPRKTATLGYFSEAGLYSAVSSLVAVK